MLRCGPCRVCDGAAWLTGPFDVDFVKPDYVEASCPDHKVTGQFGVPVCL